MILSYCFYVVTETVTDIAIPGAINKKGQIAGRGLRRTAVGPKPGEETSLPT
jgi:hypothetical protein